MTLVGEASTTLSKLSALRKQDSYTDVTIRIRDDAFQVHRCILAANSDFMHALFSCGMRESGKTEVTIDDIAPAVFATSIDFIYDGSCEVDESALPAILEGAVRLQLEPLQAAALEAVKARLDATTALPPWTMGERLTLPSLVTAATAVAVEGFESIATTNALLEASHAQFTVLLQDERVESEEVVFRAVQHWHDHARPAEADLIALLRHVRFGCLPSAFVQSTVRAWPPMRTPAAAELFIEALAGLCPGGTPLTARKPPRQSA